MIFGFLCLAYPAMQAPDFNEIELRFKPRLEKIGGSLAWVREGKQWELSLDVDNDKREFDCSSVKDLSRLAALRVMRGRIRESSLKELRSLPSLHLLVVTSQGIGQKGMAEIGRLSHLDKLDVQGPAIDRKGLSSIAKLTSLRRLFLYGTGVTGDDLAPLKSMAWLDEVSLPNSVSQAAADDLARALPKARIIVPNRRG